MRKSALIKSRCAWCGVDPLYVRYHDEEWGVPVFEDGKLFEFLILEGAQAGLSWLTVLRKRENYRQALDGFSPEKIACYDECKIESLLKNPGIIRNRLKIESASRNAKAFLKIQDEFGSFSNYQWPFVSGKPIQSQFKTLKELPAKTPESDVFSKDLKKRGFNFVGSTIIYAYMQAMGMVNDHLVSCFRHQQTAKLLDAAPSRGL